MKPEAQKQLLPLGLLIGGLVCGGICWFVDGAVFWVLTVVSLALIIAGGVAARQVTGAQRSKDRWG